MPLKNLLQDKLHQILCSAFASLQIKNFRYFWCGQCVSLVGTWMQRTAQVWLVYTLTDSPLMVGLIGVCQFLPMLLFTLFAGVIVDHYPSKKIIVVWTQFLFMLQALAFTLLTYFDLIQYWHVFILSATFGILQTFDMPARQSFFNELVGRQNIMNAISLNSTIVNIAKMIGPAIAGLVMVQFGMVVCFFLNFLSFLAVLTSLHYIHPEPQPPRPQSKERHILAEMKEGITYIWQNEELKFNVLFMAIICTFAMNTEVVNPVFAKEVLQGDSGTYTSLMSSVGVGALFAAVYMSARAAHGVDKRLFILSMSLTCGLQLLLYLVTSHQLAMLCIAIIGFANLVFMNLANSVFQVNAEPQYRGRVMSVYAFLNQGSTPIGNFYAGALMEHCGGVSGFPGCGLISVFFLGLLYLLKKDQVRTWLTNTQKVKRLS
jgi:MFS family permease